MQHFYGDAIAVAMSGGEHRSHPTHSEQVLELPLSDDPRTDQRRG
jgi:hypothetical protein